MLPCGLESFLQRVLPRLCDPEHMPRWGPGGRDLVVAEDDGLPKKEALYGELGAPYLARARHGILIPHVDLDLPIQVPPTQPAPAPSAARSWSNDGFAGVRPPACAALMATLLQTPPVTVGCTAVAQLVA